jgi:UTP-glucose-1-phosphate uridylyltransferase/mevalonate kinase
MKLFVPGRICLFGEHSDWAGGYRRVNPDIDQGYTLICGTSQGIYAEVEPHPDALLLTATTPEGETRGPVEIPMEPQALLAQAQRGGFWSYIAGVAYQAAIHYQVRGLVVHNYRTDLPIKKGLSSSAAICVLAARAFNRLYDLKLTTRGEMELAYLGEVTTPSRCGRMDQGCAFGNRPVLMTFDGDRLETTEMHAGRDLHFVVVDLQAQKDTMRILADLNDCFPCAEGQVARGVRELLGPLNKRIVHQAMQALEAGDARQLGTLMAEAQALFDRYAIPACSQELAAPVLHRVLSHAPIQSHVWGGKGVGSQGDGTAQFVARSEADQQAVVDILRHDLGLHCLTLTLVAPTPAHYQASLPPGRPVSQPASRRAHQALTVRKAVIPAAGLGTRLFPATRATKKELFPVVDRDGIAKPAILLIVEEALAAGIEEVILVVQEGDREIFHSFFNGHSLGGLPSHLQAYARHITEIGHRLSFAVQPVQDGFGHAVYSARAAVGNEPFLLMLGDHLYRSDHGRSCARQLIDVYERYGTAVLGLRRTPEREVVHYGTVTGTWLETDRLLRVSRLVEKPSVADARAFLHVPGLPEDEYLTLFGLYLLTPQVFDCLEEQIAHNVRERGEIQLTTALEQVRQADGFLGLQVDGQAYDIGLPESYLAALHAFRQASR